MLSFFFGRSIQNGAICFAPFQWAVVKDPVDLFSQSIGLMLTMNKLPAIRTCSRHRKLSE
jgi:hypothetical protein